MIIGVGIGLALAAVLGLTTGNLVLAIIAGVPLAAGLGVAGAFLRFKGRSH